MSEKLRLPEYTATETGDERRVGVEIEFTGLTPNAIADCVTGCCGGAVERISRYERSIDTPEFGRFNIELDFRYLKELAREQQSDPDTSDLEQFVTDLLGDVAENFVPYELVTPPIPLSKLYRLSDIVRALHDAGALGTSDALHYAFGVQFNPELPSLDASTIVAYFKAYLSLQDWLTASGDTDMTRRVTPYIRPFPADYHRMVIDPRYWPDIVTFTEDYLKHNPTRNRGLDLLPLLAYLDEERVRETVKDEKVNKRPTLHYRLPNSDIGNSEWGLDQPWNGWLQVEALANDQERLTTVCRAYLAHLDSPIPDWLSPWRKQVGKWLDH